MAANDLTFEQISRILNQIARQATGEEPGLSPTNTASFVSVADITIKAGYDNVLNAISQVLGKTIFSIRPYSRKFNGMEVSESAWGHITRKLSIADSDLEDDDRYKWPVGWGKVTGEVPVSGDGKTIDQYIIKKPNILQTNFYGSSVFSDHYTIFKDQLEHAFKGPDEFAGFLSMVSGNMSDKLEQTRENIARATICNLIGGVLDENNANRVFHALTRYNEATGNQFTAQDLLKPANFKAFTQWLYGQVAIIASRMTERSELYQTVVNGRHVMRHTPYSDQRLYLNTNYKYMFEMMAIADVYHDNYLKLADTESVNYWQSIITPTGIELEEASRLATTGEVMCNAVTHDNVIGILCDREACGYATTQQWARPTPFNARGGYSNMWFHETIRCWNDNTEKAIVITLD